MISQKRLGMVGKKRVGIQKQQLSIWRWLLQSKGKRVMLLAFFTFIAPTFLGIKATNNQALATEPENSQPQNLTPEAKEEEEQLVAQTLPPANTSSPTDP